MSKLRIEWCDVPDYSLQLALRRTGDMASHYGRNIRAMPIETLAASCYLQGVNDCLDGIVKNGIPDQPKPITDFQI